MGKAVAEFIGTFTLVFFGCGAAVIAGPGIAEPNTVGVLGIAFAFGLAIVAMAYAIGPVSGCHVNPAVSLGALVAGRLSVGDFITYVIAQVAGAIVGALVLFLIVKGKATGWDGGMGTRWLGTPAISGNTASSRRSCSRSWRPSSSWSSSSASRTRSRSTTSPASPSA